MAPTSGETNTQKLDTSIEATSGQIEGASTLMGSKKYRSSCGPPELVVIQQKHTNMPSLSNGLVLRQTQAILDQMLISEASPCPGKAPLASGSCQSSSCEVSCHDHLVDF